MKSYLNSGNDGFFPTALNAQSGRQSGNSLSPDARGTGQRGHPNGHLHGQSHLRPSPRLFGDTGQPQPSPMVIPCSMVGVWHYQEQTWEADLGVTWFDALSRTIEIVYRPAGQGGTFQYTGNHFSARDRWLRCFQEIPYTDLPQDMVAMAGQILPWFSPLDGSSSSSRQEIRHEIWCQGRILGLDWELWFIGETRVFPLGRHGWHLHFLREGLAKSWKTT